MTKSINYKDFKISEEQIRKIRANYPVEKRDIVDVLDGLQIFCNIKIVGWNFKDPEKKAEWKKFRADLEDEIFGYEMSDLDIILEYMRQTPKGWRPSEASKRMLLRMFKNEELIKEAYKLLLEERGETVEKFYESMYDYVKNCDFSHYEIVCGGERETPFVEEFKPAEDPEFFCDPIPVKHAGDWYLPVNFGESERSYLLESALYDSVSMVYVEGDEEGTYVPETGRILEEFLEEY